MGTVISLNNSIHIKENPEKPEYYFVGDKFTGKLCFFFPFKLKSTVPGYKRFRREWNSVEKRQRRIVKSANYPSTELMDNKSFIEEREEVLSRFRNHIPVDTANLGDSSPFATPCLKQEYENSREDNLFAKEVSVIISRFELSIPLWEGVNPKPKIKGAFLFNVNLDNLVGTSILVLNFNELSVDKIVLLKHHLYKRGLVDIQEFNVQDHKDCMCHLDDDSHRILEKKYQQITIQQYIVDNTPWISHAKSPMDSRARYSLLEIEESNLRKFRKNDISRFLVALRDADEGWCHFHKVGKEEPSSTSSRDCYDFYLRGMNGLIITVQSLFEKYRNKKEDFLCGLKISETHYLHNKDKFRHNKSCIPGVGKKYFPSFLKAVEISYLINDVVTSEITPQEKSYFNPLTIIRRGYKLWQLIYDLDINKYHISYDIHSSFGIDTSMQEIRNEYKDLVTHAISYLAIIIAIITLIVTALK